MFSSFSDEMTYGTQDAFRDLNGIASDTARTMKSEFNNAFQSVIDGTQTVGDAFRKMATDISKRIQQLALEMSTNALFNSLFSSVGGVPSAFKSPLGRANGGYIQGFSTGGKVLGGSGTKDDVPAALSRGEYVIKKSSVNKYGTRFLNSLNQGGVVGLAGGGSLGGVGDPISEDLIAEYLKNSNKTPASETDTGRVVDANLKDQLGKSLASIYEGSDVTYSDAFSKLSSSNTASGGAFRANLAAFYTADNKYATAGSYVVDPLLSQMALFDENDPQNQINQQNREMIASYLKEGIDNYERNRETIIGTIEANREEKRRIDQINQEQRDAFDKQQENNLKGAFIQAGMSIAGGAASTYAAPALQKYFSPGGGNPFMAGNRFGSQTVKRATPANQSSAGDYNVNPYKYATYVKDGGFMGFAKGGSSGKDDIPAMLMGGEYVMKKDAVNTYGRKFFDDLNVGKIRKFADGGMVANSPDYNNNESSSSSSSNNNISITVNLSNTQASSETSSQNQNSKSNDPEQNRKDIEQAKELTLKIKTEVVKVINEQQRPGGLLSSSKYNMAN